MTHIMKFGQHKGSDISEVPEDYLEWMLRNGEESVKLASDELKRRRMKIDNSAMMMMITYGRDALVEHMKAGTVTNIDLNKIALAFDRLKLAIEDAAGSKKP